MADTPIPDDLLALSRRHAAAHAETARVAREGGDVVTATRVEAALAAELADYREAHPEWATVGAQKRVREVLAES